MAIVLAISACSGGGAGDNATRESAPTPGGTLRLVGSGDIDHLDTASAFYTPTYKLLRALTRQLVTYPNEESFTAATAPVPDLAAEIPEPADGGRTYTFTLREGVQWDAPSGPRDITAEDVARGFKRLCNPVDPASVRDYYQGVIAGMDDFCDGFAAIAPEIDSMKDYIEGTDIAGIGVINDRNVEFTLDKPANDFLNILALPSSSPAPIEALDYLPDSPEYRQHFIASGPYKIEDYAADEHIILSRNPAWRPETDPVRAAYVDRIDIRMGLDEQAVQDQLEAGTADMQWDTQVPVADLTRLRSAADHNLAINADGSANPYLVINLQSPSSSKALSKPAVRRAINYAVNKRAIVEALGGPTLHAPIGQVLTPTVVGHTSFDPYATLRSAGDPVKARQLLMEAGYPSGITLRMPHRTNGKHSAVAQIVRQSLAEAGIRVELVAVDESKLYADYLLDSAAGRDGEWDIALVAWAPAWPGNAARSFFVPLLDGRTCGSGSTNYGCYNNPTVNALIERALTAPSPAEASTIWHRADRQVMVDAAWAPLATGSTVNYRADRVEGWVYLPVLQDGDLTNVWLAKVSEP